MPEPDEVMDGTIDKVLRYLLVSISENNMELEITITVGGQLIEGTLVPPAAWFGMLEEKLADRGKDTKTLISNLSDMARHHTETAELSSEQQIHLARAVSWRGGEKAQFIGLWRGRISQVSGWTLGLTSE